MIGCYPDMTRFPHRYIGLYEPVGAPSGPRLLKFLLLPNEISCPPLTALMPAPLRVMVSSLRTIVACGPLARMPVPALFTTDVCSTTRKDGAWPAVVSASMPCEALPETTLSRMTRWVPLPVDCVP